MDSGVESTDPDPEGCPFSAVGDFHALDDGTNEFTSFDDLAWSVETYPHVRLDPRFELETVVPGRVGLSGEGVEYRDETDMAIDGLCKVGISGMGVTLLADGRFEFSVNESLMSTCNRGQV